MKYIQAFPVSSVMGDINEGMTLRDYFAGQAMIALMSNSVNNQYDAIYCYRIADAMLKAREEV
jgi:hypothetical protein